MFLIYFPPITHSHQQLQMTTQKELGWQGCPRLTHLLPDLLILGQPHDHFHILIGQLSGCQLVVLLGNVIGQDHGGKHWEPVGSIQGAIVVVVVDPCQLLGTRRWCVSASSIQNQPPLHFKTPVS